MHPLSAIRSDGAWQAVWRLLALLLLPLLALSAHGQEDSAQALASAYQGLRQQLASSALGVPVVIASFDQGDVLRGDVYALLDQPFASLQPTMVLPSQWCQMILLHLNISACTSAQSAGQDGITFYTGGKANVLLGKAFPVHFQFELRDASPAHLEVQLRAADGPLGSSDYRISLSAIPVAQGSFIRFSYSFHSSVASRLATTVYLATVGHGKMGFTVTGKGSDGSPQYIGGTRGIAERNAVRYYFALQAHMESLKLPPAQRFANASARWFDLTERYPAQLHEIERQDYLDAKQLEVREQSRLQQQLDAQNPVLGAPAIP